MLCCWSHTCSSWPVTGMLIPFLLCLIAFRFNYYHTEGTPVNSTLNSIHGLVQVSFIYCKPNSQVAQFILWRDCIHIWNSKLWKPNDTSFTYEYMPVDSWWMLLCSRFAQLVNGMVFVGLKLVYCIPGVRLYNCDVSRNDSVLLLLLIPIYSYFMTCRRVINSCWSSSYAHDSVIVLCYPKAHMLIVCCTPYKLQGLFV
jgi:hypothetical protein